MKPQDPNQIWKTTLAQIEIKLDSPAQYKTFFSGIKLSELKENKATISVANGYISDWLQQKYYRLIRETLSHVASQDVELEFIVEPDYQRGTPKKLTKAEQTQIEDDDKPLLSMQGGVHHSVMDSIKKAGLNERYSLQDFIVGDSNQIAYAAAQAVIENPGASYNPLFLHGKTGVGKTHLAQSVGRSILERNPSKRVVYLPSETFLNDMVRSLRAGKMEEFRNRYRTASMLIIDDIQLISKWVQTQTEFFNTFNVLHEAKSHIILISDRPPEEIKDLEERLRSRFQGGLVAAMAKPDFELRLAILERKANQAGVQLSERIMHTIAENVTDNVRALEGALQSVSLFNQMKKDGELSAEEVKRIIGADSDSKRSKVNTSQVLRAVAKSFQVSVKDLKGTRRTKDVALARQVCMYILREEYEYKLEQVASYLKRSDHTTVIHAVDKVNSHMQAADHFKNQVVEIIRQLNEGTDDF